MKCPECSHDQKVKLGLNCGRCGYTFVFNPKHGVGMTDGRFRALLRQTSQDGTQWFTMNQLYGRYCRLEWRKALHRRPGCVWFSLASLLIGLLLGAMARWVGETLNLIGVLGFVFGAIGTVVIVLSKLASRVPREDDIELLVRTWRNAGRKIDKLLEEPSLHDPPPEWQESDIYDYGVERVLVVEHDLLVDLFVLNGWHAENRALVIAESGYPEYLLPHARRVLEERVDLPVFVLHDATPEGLGMRTRLQGSHLLPLCGREIVDLGLSPENVRRMERLRPCAPARYPYHAPVDLLPFGVLGSGVAAAAVAGVPLGALLAQEQAATAVEAGIHSHFG